ncbi:MAG: flagellar biosynthesis protein FlgL, partial [Xanthobacteraceae bacterium]
MTVSGIGNRSALTVQPLLDMRRRLDELQRQLGTGKKANTYAGIGLDRGLTIGLRNSIAALDSYDDAIRTVGVRLSMTQMVLNQLDKVTHEIKGATVQSRFVIDGTGQTTEQHTAYAQFDVVLGLLNTQLGDRYLFSGKSVDQPPVETPDRIINGDGARAGLKQLISERRQADLGADGLGRLVIPAAAGAVVSMSEDVTGSPFGLKLAAISSNLTGSTPTAPAGAPPAMSIDLGAVNPNAGESVTFSFTLPDGTSAAVTLTATDTAPPGPNRFNIGATTADTANNLQAALTTAIQGLAGGPMTAASAMAAADSFFSADIDNPPQRVNGPPFDTATALVAGTGANTVIWYTGEAGGGPARSTATVRIDSSITVSYGTRANEEALRLAVQNIAVFAATSYSAADPYAAASYDALTQKVGAGLDGAPGKQKISNIGSEIAGVQTALAGATERHQQTRATLKDLLQSIESVSQEEVGVQILALHTSLE